MGILSPCRRGGSSAGGAGTSGLAVVPVSLPVQLPENNRSTPVLVPEVAPKEIIGSTAEHTGTSGLPEVPVLLPGHSRGETEVPPAVPPEVYSGSTGEIAGTSGKHRKTAKPETE